MTDLAGPEPTPEYIAALRVRAADARQPMPGYVAALRARAAQGEAPPTSPAVGLSPGFDIEQIRRDVNRPPPEFDLVQMRRQADRAAGGSTSAEDLRAAAALDYLDTAYPHVDVPGRQEILRSLASGIDPIADAFFLNWGDEIATLGRERSGELRGDAGFRPVDLPALAFQEARTRAADALQGASDEVIGNLAALGVTAPLALGGKGVQGATWLGNLTRGARAGALGGAVAGAGTAHGENRLGSAGTGAVGGGIIGGGIGGLAVPAAHLAGRIGRDAGARAYRALGGQAATRPEIGGERAVLDVLTGDYGDDAVFRLLADGRREPPRPAMPASPSTGGQGLPVLSGGQTLPASEAVALSSGRAPLAGAAPQPLIADARGGLLGMALSAAHSSPAARRTSAEFVETATRSFVPRVQSRVDALLRVTAADSRRTVGEVTARRAREASENYTTLAETPINLDQPGLRDLYQRANRLGAFDYARKLADAEGRAMGAVPDLIDTAATISGEGAVLVTQALLDRAKVAFRNESEGVGLGRALMALRKRIIEATPGLAEANAAYAGGSGLLRAHELGQGFLNEGAVGSAEDLAGVFRALASPEERDLFRLGAARALQQRLAQAPDASGAMTNTGEAVAARLISKEVMDRLRAIAPDTAAVDDFGKWLGAEHRRQGRAAALNRAAGSASDAPGGVADLALGLAGAAPLAGARASSGNLLTAAAGLAGRLLPPGLRHARYRNEALKLVTRDDRQSVLARLAARQTRDARTDGVLRALATGVPLVAGARYGATQAEER